MPKSKAHTRNRKPRDIKFHRDTFLFHHSIRVGPDGKPIVFTKFRTMKLGAAYRHPPEWDIAITSKFSRETEDTRITRIGKWLRKLHIDELPQIINLIRRDVKLLGIRPIRR